MSMLAPALDRPRILTNAFKYSTKCYIAAFATTELINNDTLKLNPFDTNLFLCKMKVKLLIKITYTRLNQ